MAVEIQPEIRRPRVRAKDHEDEKVERLLEDWATWCHTKLLGQGYGGGVDLSQVTPRAAGVHADPVLMEFLAAENDDQGDNKRVHSIILGYNRNWRRVAWLRWVGRPVVTEWREMRVTKPVEIARRKSFPMTLACQVPANPSAWRYSGLQTMVDVATQMGVSLRTVEGIVAQVKRQLPLDLAAVKFAPRRHARRTVDGMG